MRIGIGNKRLIRIIAFIGVLCLIASVFSGCGKDSTANAKYRKINVIALESGVIASNQNYELLWDNSANAVLLKSLKTGEIWSDILYSGYLEGSTSANTNSGLLLNIANTKTLKFNTIRSYSEIPSNGNIVCKAIENGIRVTYFFDGYEIAVPVDYVLREDSVSVSVNTAQILENATEYMLLSVSIAPFMCSVKNDVEKGYLFVPTGSGAIMNTTETADGSRHYVAEVYGKDAARQVPRKLTDEEDIKIPVFGAVDSDSAVMGIIEQGAGAAEIEAQAGNDRTGYSNIYVNFYVRGYDEFLYVAQGSTKGSQTTRVGKYISGHNLSVGFYPLYGDDADYAGMAKRYREYLKQNSNLRLSDGASSPYSVTFLGGTNITESILGIPNKKTVAMTTFEQAENILKQLNKGNGISPTVRLLGFGDNGISAGSISGGRKYPSIYGGKKQIDSLQEYCESNNISIFFDSDIVFFSKSSLGFSKNLSSALTAINKRIVHYPVSPIKIQDKSNGYAVVSREKLQKAAEVAFKKAEKYKNTGVSLSSLGYTAFSDNSDRKYYTKYGIEADAANIIEIFRKKGIKTAVASANGYAATAADVIFDVSCSNGEYSVFDNAVPFYQMVFHGYKDIYTEPLNLNDDYDRMLAKAVSYGMGLGYSLINSYVADSDELDVYKLYGMVYEDNAESIKKTMVNSKFSEIYLAVRNAEIVDYEIISDGVTKTLYSNGRSVYVNHTDKQTECPLGVLEAYEFAME